MQLLGTKIEKGLFQLYVARINNTFQEFENELRLYLIEQRLSGKSDATILSELVESQNNGRGIFKDLAGAIEKRVDGTGFKLFQHASNNFADTRTKYVWQLDPSAEHCDSCLYQASRGELGINEFPIPGSQETHGETNCNEYCKCTLVKAVG
ncbi:MAG: hypothetical protein EPO24_09430 [Bacteroidetes bacterium]|nr:MAG: hypothetical protein EPO24_09430 [Bacteroidota bacterium]